MGSLTPIKEIIRVHEGDLTLGEISDIFSMYNSDCLDVSILKTKNDTCAVQVNVSEENKDKHNCGIVVIDEIQDFSEFMYKCHPQMKRTSLVTSVDL